jgi:hypothetical protein
MADEGAVGVIEAPVVDAGQDNSAEESTQSITTNETGTKEDITPQDDKLDGRAKPDALKKFVADLRRQADAEPNPTRKAEILAHVKSLNDKVGKVGAYEGLFPTVREVKEVKALLDTVGANHNGDWRQGFQQMRTHVENARAIDAQLSAGDPAVVEKIWNEAPEGVPKLIPALVDKFATEKPAEYQKFAAGFTAKALDDSKIDFNGRGYSFPVLFDHMASLYAAGNIEAADAIRFTLNGWVVRNRQATTQAVKVDPEVEKLRTQLQERDQKDTEKAIDTAYNAVVAHAPAAIDKALKPLVAKLGLSTEQYNKLRSHVWDDIQTTRNQHPTYKTVAPSKQQQGYDKFTEYANQWTDDNAAESARKVAHLYYGHQLKNGVKTTVDATKQPTAQTVVTGQMPKASEIDYGPKGQAFAKKLGFANMQDYVLGHKVLLNDGTVRMWK